MSRRRRLILQSIAATLAPLSPMALAGEPRAASQASETEQTIRSLLDTLVPADESPSASALSVDRTMLERGRREPRYQQFLDEGTLWLNAAARAAGARSFHGATEQQRIAIVQQAERSRTATLPKRFFQRMRNDALYLYYSQPAAWSSLGYAGPPQPAGFPDFERAPGKRG